MTLGIPFILTPPGLVCYREPLDRVQSVRDRLLDSSVYHMLVHRVFDKQAIPRRYRIVPALGGEARAWRGYWFTRPGEVRLPA